MGFHGSQFFFFPFLKAEGMETYFMKGSIMYIVENLAVCIDMFIMEILGLL